MFTHDIHTLPLPVDELGDGAEVVAQAEGVDVADGGQAEVQLQGLLPVRPFDLQRHGDGLTFPLLQPGQVSQQAGALLSAVAPQQAHPRTHQSRQSAVIATCSLKRT